MGAINKLEIPKAIVLVWVLVDQSSHWKALKGLIYVMFMLAVDTQGSN